MRLVGGKLMKPDTMGLSPGKLGSHHGDPGWASPLNVESAPKGGCLRKVTMVTAYPSQFSALLVLPLGILSWIIKELV